MLVHKISRSTDLEASGGAGKGFSTTDSTMQSERKFTY